MKMVHAALLAAGLAGLAPASAAAPGAVVEGVQMPAWLEREGRIAPLAPGMELRSGDRVRTGGGSRLLLKLAEGSLVKLGENATMRLSDLVPDAGGGLFQLAMNVLEGAFRFTTEVVARERKRSVNITVATVTAGIRGTDLWGRSREERQIVVLIEGKIEIGAEGEKPLLLDQPLQFYQRERGKTLPVTFIERARLDELAKETEIDAGAGAARRSGRFRAAIAAVDTQSEALALYDRLRELGYAAEIAPRKDGERLVYRVELRGIGSRTEADALEKRLREALGRKAR
jgi:hypothetical protein